MAAAHLLPEPMTAWSLPDCSVGQLPAESKLHTLKSITSELTWLRKSPDTDRAEKALDGFHHTCTLPFADPVVPVAHSSPAGGLTPVYPDRMQHWLYTKLGLDPFSFWFLFPLAEWKGPSVSYPTVCIVTCKGVHAASELKKASETGQGNIVSTGTFCPLAMLR